MEAYNYEDNGLLVIRDRDDFEFIGRVKINKLHCFSIYKNDVIKVSGELYKVIDFSEIIEHDTVIERQILVEWIENVREFEIE